MYCLLTLYGSWKPFLEEFLGCEYKIKTDFIFWGFCEEGIRKVAYFQICGGSRKGMHASCIVKEQGENGFMQIVSILQQCSFHRPQIVLYTIRGK